GAAARGAGPVAVVVAAAGVETQPVARHLGGAAVVVVHRAAGAAGPVLPGGARAAGCGPVWLQPCRNTHHAGRWRTVEPAQRSGAGSAVAGAVGGPVVVGAA